MLTRPKRRSARGMTWGFVTLLSLLLVLPPVAASGAVTRSASNKGNFWGPIPVRLPTSIIGRFPLSRSRSRSRWPSQNAATTSPTEATMMTKEDPSPPVFLSGVTTVTPRLMELVLASEATRGLSCMLGKGPTAIIAVANFVVYGCWQKREWLPFMRKHFVMNSKKMRQREDLQTILLSGFSHQDEGHLLGNMVVLAMIGPTVEQHMGPRWYSYFYISSIYLSQLLDHFLLGGGKILSLRFLFWKIKIPKRSLGASGAISSVISYLCLKFPRGWIDLTKLIGVLRDETKRKKRPKPNQKPLYPTTPPPWEGIGNRPSPYMATNDDDYDDTFRIQQVKIRAWLMGLFMVAADVVTWVMITMTNKRNRGDDTDYGAHVAGYLYGATVMALEHLWGKRKRDILPLAAATTTANTSASLVGSSNSTSHQVILVDNDTPKTNANLTDKNGEHEEHAACSIQNFFTKFDEIEKESNGPGDFWKKFVREFLHDFIEIN